MGEQALSVASAGQDIPADHHNELVAAFLQNIVPRNASRTAQDLAGSLGTSALRFLRAYVQTYHIGQASNNLIVYEGDPGEIWIERNGPTKEQIKLKDGSLEFIVAGTVEFRVNSSGIDWTTQNSRSIPFQKLNYTTVDCPTKNSNGFVYYTTTDWCLIAFNPIGSRMEDDSPVGVFIENMWIDTDGDGNQVYLHYSQGTSTALVNQPSATTGNHGSQQVVLCPPGKLIKSYCPNSTDRVGGTLYVFPLG